MPKTKNLISLMLKLKVDLGVYKTGEVFILTVFLLIHCPMMATTMAPNSDAEDNLKKWAKKKVL